MFVIIMHDVYDITILPYVREIESHVNGVEDSIKADKLIDGIALTPQQIKKGVQKWHAQFVSHQSFSCAHTHTHTHMVPCNYPQMSCFAHTVISNSKLAKH